MLITCEVTDLRLRRLTQMEALRLLQQRAYNMNIKIGLCEENGIFAGFESADDYELFINGMDSP